MKKKNIITSSLCLGLVLFFSGCDWCGCCKKEAAPTAAVEPKTPETKMPEPKIPVVPEAKESPMIHPSAPEQIHPMPMPVEPKMAPMPIEPAKEMPMPIEAKAMPTPIEPVAKLA